MPVWPDIVWFLIKSSDLPALKRKGGGGSKSKVKLPKLHVLVSSIEIHSCLIPRICVIIWVLLGFRLSKQVYPCINPKITAQVQKCNSVYCIRYKACSQGCDDDFSVNWAAKNGPNGRLFRPYNLKDK